MIFHMTEMFNHFLKSVCFWKTHHMLRTKFQTFLTLENTLEGLEDKYNPRLVTFKITKPAVKSHMLKLTPFPLIQNQSMQKSSC